MFIPSPAVPESLVPVPSPFSPAPPAAPPPRVRQGGSCRRSSTRWGRAHSHRGGRSPSTAPGRRGCARSRRPPESSRFTGDHRLLAEGGAGARRSVVERDRRGAPPGSSAVQVGHLRVTPSGATRSTCACISSRCAPAADREPAGSSPSPSPWTAAPSWPPRRVTAEQAVHLAGRTRPESLERREALLATEHGGAGLVSEGLVRERQRTQRLALRRRPLDHVVVEAGSRCVRPRRASSRGCGRAPSRVHDRAAVAARVQIGRGTHDVDLEVGEPAQRREDRGSPGANIAESEMITQSQASSFLCVSMKGARCSLPTPPLPRRATTTFTGSAPRTARCACSAFTCRKSWPLSSTEPRA